MWIQNINYLRRNEQNVSKINPAELTKLYYSIGEVADMFDVNTSLIRFWEKEFNSIRPKKNKKGNRLFSPKDVIAIDQIYLLVKEKGFTLEGAKKAMKSGEIPADEGSTNSDVIQKLESIREKLLNLKSN